MNKIVSIEWLYSNLDNKNLIILDASLTKTASGKGSDFADKIIPNARRFKIKEKFTNQSSIFPNTVPSAKQFEDECQKLGINKNSQIIVYDNIGIYSSPRVWWLFNYMGHQNIAVLNGGLPHWIANQYPTVTIEKVEYSPGNFTSKIQAIKLKSIDEIRQNIKKQEFLLIDARSEGRFNNTAKDPRENIPSGSIPNSVNIPFQNILKNGKFKSSEELKDIFSKSLGHHNKLAFTCGSGLTACILLLASELTQKKEFYLYDGSWTEWAELQLK